MTFHIKKILPSRSFFADFIALMKGNVISQLITLCSLPVLMKLFSPAQFGDYALFFTIASILGFIIHLRFDAAIMLHHSDVDKTFRAGLQIAVLNLMILIFLSIIFVFLNHVFHWFKIHDWVVLLVPFASFFIGLAQLFSSLKIRFKEFRLFSSNKIIQTASNASFSVIIGLFYAQSWILVLGFLIGSFISILHFLSFRVYSIIKTIPISKDDFKSTLLIHSDFIKYSVPKVFLNTISLNLLVFFLKYRFSSNEVGLYVQAYKVVSYPLYLITLTFSPLFFQRFSTSSHKKSMFLKSIVLSLIIGFLILSPLLVCGEWLFDFVFGEAWRLSGKFAALLIPITIISFAVGNTSTLFSVEGKQRMLLLWQISYLLVMTCFLILIKQQSLSVIIFAFSCVSSLFYAVLAYLSFKILQK